MQDKFTVICPTMWLCNEFIDFIDLILLNDDVAELIIINNNNKITPILPKNEKLSVLDLNTNIGVNQSWNLGFIKSKCDLLAIINDDIQFDLNILKVVKNFVIPKFGMFGMNIFSKEDQVTISSIDDRRFGYACSFFIHKSSYYLIPRDLKIYFGDDWVFTMNKIHGKPNMIINGLKCSHSVDLFGGLTSRKFLYLLDKEKEIYNTLITQYDI
jgi:hypothetical protein